MQRLSGRGASPGVASGRALLLVHSAHELRFPIPADAVDREVARLGLARDRSRDQLREIRTRVARSTGADVAGLFDAQLLMLDDPMLVPRAAALVATEHLNAEWALDRAFEELAAVFDQIEDPYLRDRKGDIADVVGRVRLNLRGASRRPQLPADLTGPYILVADDLAASVAVQIDWTRVVGFLTDAGTWTSHTAILARSLHVPAVVGLHDGSRRIPPGAALIVDGTTGEVVVDPPPSLLADVEGRQARRAAYERSLREYRSMPAITADGVRVRLEANIELLEDLPRAREHGAEGIGLYRSEFLLRDRDPASATEETQFAGYRALVEQMAPHEVTIRTFDVAEAQADAEAAGADVSRGRLGLRAIRLSLASRDAFRTQLRALLRAARYGRLRIMFPFVSSLEELREARRVLGEAAAELHASGEAVPRVPVGVMIEIPSAAIAADLLAREADFFSIGTNDLIQYSLAVDRTDDRVSHLYEPLNPAILRLLRLVRRVARRWRVPLAVCGEMASDPVLLTLLVGLGFTTFSMAPAAIPLAKQVVRELRADEARQVAGGVLRSATVKDIEHQLLAYVARRGSAGAVNE